MKNKNYMLTILVIFLTSCASSKPNYSLMKNDMYNYIEIAECNIPINNQYNLIEKKSQYEYQYFKMNNDPSKMLLRNPSYLSIFSKKRYSYKDVMKNFKSIKDMKYISQTEIGSFIVIEYSLEFDSDSKNFELIGDQSTIQLLNTSKEEVDYLIKYCDNNKMGSEGSGINY